MKKHSLEYGRRHTDGIRKIDSDPCPKQEFVAVINHDLRTPLNAVIGFAQIIEKEIHGKVPEEYLEYAKHIQDSGYDLLSKINDLLDAPAPEGPRRGSAQQRKAKKLVAAD